MANWRDDKWEEYSKKVQGAWNEKYQQPYDKILDTALGAPPWTVTPPSVTSTNTKLTPEKIEEMKRIMIKATRFEEDAVVMRTKKAVKKPKRTHEQEVDDLVDKLVDELNGGN